MKLNQWQFIGYLGSDPEIRFTKDGEKEIISFRVGVDASRKKDGEWEDNTIWARVTCFGDRFAWLKDRLAKGTPVFVQGKLDIQAYVNREGEPGASAEVLANDVQVLLKKGEGGGSNGRDHWGTGATGPAKPARDAKAPAKAAAGGVPLSGRRQELAAEDATDLEDLPF